MTNMDYIKMIKLDLDKRGIEYQAAVDEAIEGLTNADEIEEATLNALAEVVARLDTGDEYDKMGASYTDDGTGQLGDGDNWCLLVGATYLHDGYTCSIQWAFDAAEADTDDLGDLPYDWEHVYSYQLKTVGKSKYHTGDVNEITEIIYA